MARSSSSGRIGGGMSYRGSASYGGAYRGGSGGIYRGGYGGTYRGGYSTASRGGYGRGGYGHGSGYGRGYGRGWGLGFGYLGWPYYGYGYGYGWPYYGAGYYGYPYSYGYGYPYYDYGYSSDYAPADYSYPTYSYAPAQSPVVVVNQQPPAYEPQAAARDYRDEASGRGYDRDQAQAQGPPPYRTPIYKIAFNDHTMVSAVAYWVKDGRLHYVTLDHEMRDVALSAVDRRFSEQVNRDLGLTFRLPAEK